MNKNTKASLPPLYSSLDKETLMRPLLKKFAERMPFYINRLDAAVLESPDTLKKITHEMRGTLSSYGFQEAAELCGKMERSEEDSDKSFHMAKLKECCQRIYDTYSGQQ